MLYRYIPGKGSPWRCTTLFFALESGASKTQVDWKVGVQKTDRAARELVILFTPEEIDSAVGSEEHLARLQKKITEGTKKKSWGTGSKVRRSRIPKRKKF